LLTAHDVALQSLLHELPPLGKLKARHALGPDAAISCESVDLALQQVFEEFCRRVHSAC
jgi:hypothetical protein